MEEELILAWLPKAVVYLMNQLAIGLLVVRRLTPQQSASATALQRRMAIVLSLCLLAGLAGRLWVQSAIAFGVGDAALSENLQLIGIESRWGGSWRLQVYAAATMLVTALLLRAAGALWAVFAFSSIALSLIMPLLGHAGGSAPRHVLHALHNLGAAIWLGTLGVIALWAWRPARLDSWPEVVRRFSPLALTSSTLVLVSGLIAAWIYLGTWSALTTTPYGVALLWKLGAVAVVTLCGWTNWQAVRRGSSPNRLVMTIEWLAAVLVVALTAQLTETEHPESS